MQACCNSQCRAVAGSLLSTKSRSRIMSASRSVILEVNDDNSAFLIVQHCDVRQVHVNAAQISGDRIALHRAQDGAEHRGTCLRRTAVTSTDSGLRTVGHSAAELAAEWEQQATERVADLQHVVAMLLE